MNLMIQRRHVFSVRPGINFQIRHSLMRPGLLFPRQSDERSRIGIVAFLPIHLTPLCPDVVQNVRGQPMQKNLTYGPIAPSRTYTPQVRTNLATGAWAALTGFGGPTTNVSQVTVRDRNAAQTSKLYQVRISFP